MDECTSKDEIFIGPVTDAELRARAKRGMSDNDVTLHHDFSFNASSMPDDEEVENKSSAFGRQKELSNKKQPIFCRNSLSEDVDFSLISSINNSLQDSLENLKDDSSPILLKRHRKYVESTPMTKNILFSADSLECKLPKLQDSGMLCNMTNDLLTPINFKECFIYPSQSGPVKCNEGPISNIHCDLMLTQTEADDLDQMKDRFEQMNIDELNEGKIDFNLKPCDLSLAVQKIASVVKDDNHCQENKSVSISELFKSSVIEGKFFQTVDDFDSAAPSSVDTSLSDEKSVEIVDKMSRYSTSSTVLVDEKMFAEQELESDISELLSVSKLSALHNIQEATILQYSPENNMKNSYDFEEENAIINIEPNVSLVNEMSALQLDNAQILKKSIVGELVHGGNQLDDEIILEEGQINACEICENILSHELTSHDTPSARAGANNILRDSGFHDVSVTCAASTAKESSSTLKFESNAACNIMEDINCSENTSDSGADTSTKDYGSLLILSSMDAGENTLNDSVTNLSVFDMSTICKETFVQGIDDKKLDLSQSTQVHSQVENENLVLLKSNICFENECEKLDEQETGAQNEIFLLHASDLKKDDNSFKNFQYSSHDAAEEHDIYKNETVNEVGLKETEEHESIPDRDRSPTVHKFRQSSGNGTLLEKYSDITILQFGNEDKSNQLSQQKAENCTKAQIKNHEMAVTVSHDSTIERVDVNIGIKAQNRSNNFISAGESDNSMTEEYDISAENILAEDSVVSYEVDLLQAVKVSETEQGNQAIYDEASFSVEGPEFCGENKVNSIDTTQDFHVCDESLKLEDSAVDLETTNKTNDSEQLNLASQNAISNVCKDIFESLQEFEDDEKNCLLEDFCQKDTMQDIKEKDEITLNNNTDNSSIEKEVIDDDKSNCAQESKICSIDESNMEIFEISQNDVEVENGQINATHKITNCMQCPEVPILVDYPELILDIGDRTAENCQIGIQSNIYDELSFRDDNQSKNEDMGLTRMIHDFELKSFFFENSKLECESKIAEDIDVERVVDDDDVQQCFKYADFSIAKEITMQDGTCFIQECDFDAEKDCELNVSKMSQIGLEKGGGDSNVIPHKGNNLSLTIDGNNILQEVICIDQHMHNQSFSSCHGAESIEDSKVYDLVEMREKMEDVSTLSVKENHESSQDADEINCDIIQESGDNHTETTQGITDVTKVFIAPDCHAAEQASTKMDPQNDYNVQKLNDGIINKMDEEIVIETLHVDEYFISQAINEVNLQDNCDMKELKNCPISGTAEEITNAIIVLSDEYRTKQEVDEQDIFSSVQKIVKDDKTTKELKSNQVDDTQEFSMDNGNKINSEVVAGCVESHNFDNEERSSTSDISNTDNKSGIIEESVLFPEDVEIDAQNELQYTKEMLICAKNKTGKSIDAVCEKMMFREQANMNASLQGSEICGDEYLDTEDVEGVSIAHKELKLSHKKDTVKETKDTLCMLFPQGSFYEQNKMVAIPVCETAAPDLAQDRDGLSNHYKDLIGNLNEDEQILVSPKSDNTINICDLDDSLTFDHSVINGSPVGNKPEQSLTASFLEIFENNLKIFDQSISASNPEQEIKKSLPKQKTFSANLIDNFILESDNLERPKAFDNGSHEISSTSLINYVLNEKTNSSQDIVAFGDLSNIDGLKLQDKSSKSVNLSCMSNTCMVDEFSFNEENRLRKLKELSVDGSKNLSFVSNSPEHSSKENSMSKNESFNVDQVTKNNAEIVRGILDKGISLIEDNTFYQEKTACLLETSVANDYLLDGSKSAVKLAANKDFPLVTFESPCITSDYSVSQVSFSPSHFGTQENGDHRNAADNLKQHQKCSASFASECSPSSNFKSCDKLLNNLLLHTPNKSNLNFSSSSLFNSDSKLHEQSFNIAEITQLLSNTCNTSYIEDEVLFDDRVYTLNDTMKLPVANNCHGVSLLPLSDVFETEVRSACKASHVTMRPSSVKRLSSSKRTVKVINADGMVSEILNSGRKFNPSNIAVEELVFTDDVKKKLFENDEDFIEGELDLGENLDAILARMSSSPIKKCTDSKLQKPAQESLKKTPTLSIKKETVCTPTGSFKKPVCNAKQHIPSGSHKENIPAKKNMPCFGISKTPNEKLKKTTSEFLTKSLNLPRFCKMQTDAATSSKTIAGLPKTPKLDKKTPIKSNLTSGRNLIAPSKIIQKSGLPQNSTVKSATKSRFGFCLDKTPSIAGGLPNKTAKIATPKKYLNVQSPVSKYIQETPITPLIQNVKPDKKAFTMPKTAVQPVKVPSQKAWEITKLNTPILPPAKYITKIGNKPMVRTTPVKPKPILLAQNIPIPVVTKHIGTSKVIKGYNYLVNEESLLDTSQQPRALRPPKKIQRDMNATLVHEVDIIRSNTLTKGLKKVK